MIELNRKLINLNIEMTYIQSYNKNIIKYMIKETLTEM